MLVKDMNPGPQSGLFKLNDSSIVASAGKVFFVADDGVHGNEVWVSDGTAQGTHLVADIKPGTGDGVSYDLTSIPTGVAFAADDGQHGLELWTATTTTATMVADLLPNASGSYPYYIRAVNRDLYWSADTALGRELVVSRDTGAPTILDIRAGEQGSYPSRITPFGDGVFFVTYRPDEGVELWQTDGTVSGTSRAASLLDADESPDDLIDATAAGFPGVFFILKTPRLGQEVWSYNRITHALTDACL